MGHESEIQLTDNETILPDIGETGKKSRLFRQFFQYSVICHYSKYVRLVLTDFNKNRVFL